MRITEQFNPITKTKILDMHSRRMLPIDTYLYMIKGILVPDHVNLKIPSISEFCKEWQIPRSSFYRGMSKLEKSGLGRLEPMGGSIFSCYSLSKDGADMDDGVVTNEILTSETTSLTSETTSLTSETTSLRSETTTPENPHDELVLEPLKYIQIDPDKNQINLSLDPDRVREEKKEESAIEIFSEEVSTQEGSLDKPYLSDPEYLKMLTIFEKVTLMVKLPSALAKIRADYLGKWENAVVDANPIQQANMVALDTNQETFKPINQSVVPEKEKDPIVGAIPTVAINSQLATKPEDPFFSAKRPISYRRELAKNSTTIFPDVAQEDEFYAQYRHYLKATNPRLLPGQIEAIALAALKRINSSATNPGDRAALKMWESGELKNFIGATYDAMASKVADARDRIDRALNNNRGYEHAF